jgi:O-antigen ligase
VEIAAFRTPSLGTDFVESVLLIGIVVAVVWALVLARHGDLLSGCLAYVVLVALFDARFYSLRVAEISLTVNRVAWAPLLIYYVVWRALGKTDPKRRGTSDVALLALLAMLTFSVFTHDWTVGSWRFVGGFLIPASLFWIARQAPPSERSLSWFHAALVVFAVYLAATSIAEVAEAWSFVFPPHVAWRHKTFSMFYGRGRGPMHYPMADGFYQSIGLYAAITWWPTLRRLGRLLLAPAVFVLGAGIACTLTRSVWIGSVAGLAVVLGLWLSAGWRLRAFGLVCLVAPLVAAVLMGGVWKSVLRLDRDKYTPPEYAEGSVMMRGQLFSLAWHMFRDRPVFGCGFGQYDKTLLDDYSDRSIDVNVAMLRQCTQHNVLLSLLVDTGLVGMGLYVFLLGCWVRDAWRLWRSPDYPPWARRAGLVFLGTMASYLANAMFHDLTQDSFTHIMLFTMAGAVAALVRPPLRATTSL